MAKQNHQPRRWQRVSAGGWLRFRQAVRVAADIAVILELAGVHDIIRHLIAT